MVSQMDEKKSFEVLWTKSHWKRLIDKLFKPSEQLMLKKYFKFEEAIIYFDYKKNRKKEYMIDANLNVSILPE